MNSLPIHLEWLFRLQVHCAFRLQGLFPPSDGHIGAVHQWRYFFGSGSAAAFFLTMQRQAAAPLFLAEKAAALQRPILSKYSAAAATANKLLPKLFRFTFSHVTVWSPYSLLVFTLLLLPRYFSLVEHTSLRLWRFVVAHICIDEFYRTRSYFSEPKLNE